MHRNWKFCVLLLIVGAAGSGQDPARPSLQEQFKSPPREYSMEPLWSWNGSLEASKLTWQIDQMVDKGVYGAYMHSRDGLDQSSTPYFSKGFWDAVVTSVEHGAKVGFRTWMYDEDKWPSGDAGGRTRAANPERYTATGIWPRIQEVRGPTQVRLDNPHAKAVVAAKSGAAASIDPDTLVDITDLNARSGTWDVPSGDWKLFVFEPVRRPVPLPNYLNPDAVQEFLNNTYEEYAKRVSPHFGKTIPGSFFDEIFNITLAWDPLLEERFRREKGYELRRILPAIFADAGPRAIKMRCDYFDVFTKQYEDAWFRKISQWCARHNLQLTGHTNEELHAILDQGDYFRTWRHPQMPGTDNEDFRYTFPRVVGSWKPKQLSSVAHVYGRNRAMVEALGGAGWTITLEEARYGINMLAAYGMNSFVMHLFHYTQDAVESMDDWPNSWFYQNPYWKYFRKLADHTSRVSFMGSQGEHVADVAVLYPVEEVWSHVLTRGPRSQAPVQTLTEQLVREHIDFDLVDSDNLARAQAAGNGRAKIGAETYRVLILPDVATVSAAAYTRAAELAKQGFTVIAMGRVPRHSSERGADDPAVASATASLFNGGSNVAAGVPAAIARVRQLVPADVRIDSGNGAALRHYHRRLEQRDVYFLANSERQPLSARVEFASSGRAELWDPETGQIAPLPSMRARGGASVLDLEMRPWQGYFIVFDRKGAPEGTSPARRELARTEIRGPWTFQLAPTELDYVWRANPGETRVEVPVADFRVERGDEDRMWRRVKLVDTLNPKQGASRYLSEWDAFWITRYDYNRNHPGELAGPELRFTRDITIDGTPASSKLIVVADGEGECLWNGRRIAAVSAMKPAVIEKLPVSAGANRIEIVVRGSGYLLVEGEVRSTSGKTTRIRTDRQWQVSKPSSAPMPAYEFAAPPFGKWSEPDRGVSVPSGHATVVYRIPVPPGALSFDSPAVQGRHELLLDGAALAAASGRIELPPKRSLRWLEIRVHLESATGGLLKPVVFHCSSTAGALGEWSKLGLDWYSGRAVYTTHFKAPAPRQGKRVLLDLGDVRHFGEVWVNGKLADSLVWAPYRADITGAIKPGLNELTVVVANLSANEMRWNIFDAAVSRPVSRWWHDGNILREEHKLRSGLIGPVQLIEEGK